jgi:hypothetical protein
VLEAAGWEDIFEDRGVPGAALKRLPWAARSRRCRRGSSDRLEARQVGRDLRHPVNLIHDFTTRGIGFKVLKGHGAETRHDNGELEHGPEEQRHARLRNVILDIHLQTTPAPTASVVRSAGRRIHAPLHHRSLCLWRGLDPARAVHRDA